MQVDEGDREIQRFAEISVPRWLGVELTPPDFPASPHLNSLMAFFHFA